jgi:subtilisin inhibitor-like
VIIHSQAPPVKPESLREYPARVRALLVLVALAALLAGCGSSSSGGSDGGASLTITYWADGPDGQSETWTLGCNPASGTLPDPDEACARLAEGGAELFDPPAGDAACTEIYGGPQVAHVHGTVGGETVAASLGRANGCEISSWDGLSPWLLPAGGAS